MQELRRAQTAVLDSLKHAAILQQQVCVCVHTCLCVFVCLFLLLLSAR